jgi:trans-aconitate methyltransferase
MTQSLHPSAQKGFSLGAELYQQVRPNYPQEIVVWLQDRLKIGESSTVIDLGSGTGKFLPYLIQTGAKVLAVEPVNEMLKQLQQSYPDTESFQSSADSLPSKMLLLILLFVRNHFIGLQINSAFLISIESSNHQVF